MVFYLIDIGKDNNIICKAKPNMELPNISKIYTINSNNNYVVEFNKVHLYDLERNSNRISKETTTIISINERENFDFGSYRRKLQENSEFSNKLKNGRGNSREIKNNKSELNDNVKLSVSLGEGVETTKGKYEPNPEKLGIKRINQFV